MAIQTYHQGLKIATETANRAISTESSLSSLSPLTSPLGTLQRTFHLYIQSASQYSLLLSSDLVPPSERETIKKRWGLVLGRAEKVKARIVGLGGQVGKVEVDDQGQEEDIRRRGGGMNGMRSELWRAPRAQEFEGEGWRDGKEPDMPDVEADVVWREVDKETWEGGAEPGDVPSIVRQGTGADCSVAAGLGVSLEHNRLWGSKLGSSSLYPQGANGPVRSENGKHVVKLLLNGSWRGVIIDALLPRSISTGHPLHAVTHPLSASQTSSASTHIGPPWIPLVTKAYFKSLGGYTIRGSDPGPDIYAFTGWIPERLSLREGFQREKEWRRIHKSWKEGKVLVTLGTGGTVGKGLVPFHAYGVLGMKEEEGERVLTVVDPGGIATAQALEQQMSALSLGQDRGQVSDGVMTMTWDQVCGDFEALSLNWDPALYPTTAVRHWWVHWLHTLPLIASYGYRSWPKVPEGQEGDEGDGGLDASPRYRLKVRGSAQEILILLSQHTVNKDRPLDDIALHVFEEHQGRKTRILHPERAEITSPYSNGLHVLARYTPRHSPSDLVIIASRDKGLFPRDFTLQAFAPSTTSLDLARIKASLPFSKAVHGHLNSRNSGGHPGNPGHLINPQYKVTIRPGRGGVLRMVVRGDRELAWNIKLVWGQERVTDLTEDAVIADSGAYSFGMGYCDVEDLEPGTYIAIVSTFEPGTIAPFVVSFESDRPVSVDAIPAEGAGLYARAIHGHWSTGKQNAGGRPSAGSYSSNPVVEVILPKAGIITSRLHLPSPLGYPINLTAFKRNTDSTLGAQVATTGPYSDTLSGVLLSKVKLEAGIYLLVPSTYDKGLEGSWTLNIWSDVSLSAEPAR